MDMYKEFEADRDRGNFDKLPELHAVLSGMKVFWKSCITPLLAPVQLVLLIWLLGGYNILLGSLRNDNLSCHSVMLRLAGPEHNHSK